MPLRKCLTCVHCDGAFDGEFYIVGCLVGEDMSESEDCKKFEGVDD